MLARKKITHADPDNLQPDPDGVPHNIVGVLAVSIAVAAILFGGAYAVGGVLGALVTFVLAAFGIPFLVYALGSEARRERREPPGDEQDKALPSRLDNALPEEIDVAHTASSKSPAAGPTQPIA